MMPIYATGIERIRYIVQSAPERRDIIADYVIHRAPLART